MCMYNYAYIYIYNYIVLSLSLYIYIYIHINRAPPSSSLSRPSGGSLLLSHLLSNRKRPPEAQSPQAPGRFSQ